MSSKNKNRVAMPDLCVLLTHGEGGVKLKNFVWRCRRCQLEMPYEDKPTARAIIKAHYAAEHAEWLSWWFDNRSVVPSGFSQPRAKKPMFSENFYNSKAWLRARYAALVKHGNRCQACGTSARDGSSVHVDHIVPRSIRPELELSPSNLQVLCANCNLGKSNKDETDWRPKSALPNHG